MKLKLFVLSFMMLFVTSLALGQMKVSLGLESGIDIANLSVTPSLSTNSRTTFMIQGNCELGFGHYFAVVPGIRYIGKGASSSDQANNTTETLSLNYLEIPIIFKGIYPIPQTQIKPYVLFGPSFGFQMSANDNITTPNASQSNDVSANFSGLDFGLNFGLGIGYDFTHRINAFIQFAYQLGLSNILKNPGNNSEKTYGILLTGGVFFTL